MAANTRAGDLFVIHFRCRRPLGRRQRVTREAIVGRGGMRRALALG